MCEVLVDEDGICIEGDWFVFLFEVLFLLVGVELLLQGEVEIVKVVGILCCVVVEIFDGIDWIICVDGYIDNVLLFGMGIYVNNWEFSQVCVLFVVLFMIE